MENVHIADIKYMEFGEMDRRKFLKILAATLLTAIFAPLSTFARTLPQKIIMAIRGNKYPGKIKPLNEAAIQKIGKWRG